MPLTFEECERLFRSNGITELGRDPDGIRFLRLNLSIGERGWSAYIESAVLPFLRVIPHNSFEPRFKRRSLRNKLRPV